MKRAALSLIPLAALVLWGAHRSEEIPFEKVTLSLGASETCAFADINGDRRLDVVSGENWYEAPRWARHKFRELNDANNYLDDFSDLPLDVNGDGRTDIISAAWFSRRLWWNENPGAASGLWKEHIIESGFPVEFAFLVDLDNDGKAREVLPQFGDPAAPLAWYEVQNGQFVKHVIAPNSIPHGIGAGDVNGDGRADILTSKGWFEAPPDPRSGTWAFHPDFDLGSTGFLYVLDVNGDGRADIIGSMAHDYGVFWMEQTAAGKWTKHVIDESWSQAHALTLADLNGDGHIDVITGKRYLAHNGKDPGEREPLGIYWYEFRAERGKVEWFRHVIDYGTRAGGGMQIPVADLDGDGAPDFAVAGKAGLFLFVNRSR